MPELEPNCQYYAGVDKDGRVVGPVSRSQEYAEQVLVASFSRDNSHLCFDTMEQLEEEVEKAGYKIKKVKVIVEE